MRHRRSRWPVIALGLALAGCGLAPGGVAERQAAAAPAPTFSATAIADGLAIPTPAHASPAATPLPSSGAPTDQSTCPTTKPPARPFIPPAPYPTTPPSLYAGQFWHGSDGLWTMLFADGAWRNLPRSGAGYGQKTFWWRSGYDPRADPNPALTVTGRRLDGPAPTLSATGATHGLRDDIGAFMLAGVEIPTLGCWEITGRIDGRDLSFVVWVAP
jgi:hypothetical protein